MWGGDNVTFSRDTEVIEIPAGTRITIPAGTKALITQSLGGSHTVVTSEGQMVRVSSLDADAIGQEVESLADIKPPETTEDLEKLVWDELRTVYDPEIPVNIADLGLIYKCEVNPRAEGGNKVDIDMSLTAPGCGMGDVLKVEVESKIERLPGVEECNVEVVFDPPWDMSMMPEATKLQLGIL
jgi:probable FeS assembly SUF system protein SufT